MAREERHDGAEGHEGGWCGGLKGMDEEMTKSLVHMEREFVVPVELLYDACSGTHWASIMGLATQGAKADFRVGGRYSVQLQKGEAHGEFTAIEKNKKIAFTWEGTPGGFKLEKPTQVTLEFGPWGDDGTEGRDGAGGQDFRPGDS